MQYSKIAGACLLATVFAGAAHADDDAGFYLGGGLGKAREKSGPFEGDDTSFRVFGGYNLNRFFSLEAGYIDGGKISDDVGAYRVSIESEGIFASAIGKWPIGKYFTPFAKLGYVSYESTETVGLGTSRVSETENDSDFIFGGGFEFNLGEKFRLRLEYDDVNASDASFDIFSLNATYRF